MSQEVGIWRSTPEEVTAITYYNEHGQQCAETDAWAYVSSGNFYIITQNGEPKQKEAVNSFIKREDIYKQVSGEILDMYLGYLSIPSPVNYEAVKSAFQLGGFN
jgi:hypothetical protein